MAYLELLHLLSLEEKWRQLGLPAFLELHLWIMGIFVIHYGQLHRFSPGGVHLKFTVHPHHHAISCFHGDGILAFLAMYTIMDQKEQNLAFLFHSSAKTHFAAKFVHLLRLDH